MGLIADFFVATEARARSYARRGTAVDDGAPPDLCEYENFTGTDLGLLWAILAGERFDADRHELGETWVSDDGDRWLIRFPDALTALLADAPAKKLASTAAAWAKSDELHPDVGELGPVLESLQRLARQAGEKGWAVWLAGML